MKTTKIIQLLTATTASLFLFANVAAAHSEHEQRSGVSVRQDGRPIAWLECRYRELYAGPDCTVGEQRQVRKALLDVSRSGQFPPRDAGHLDLAHFAQYRHGLGLTAACPKIESLSQGSGVEGIIVDEPRSQLIRVALQNSDEEITARSDTGKCVREPIVGVERAG